MPLVCTYTPEGVSQTCTDPNTRFSSSDPGRPQPSEGSKLLRLVVSVGLWPAQVTEDLRETKEKEKSLSPPPPLPPTHTYCIDLGKSLIVLPMRFGPSDFPWKWNVTKERRSSKYWNFEWWRLGNDLWLSVYHLPTKNSLTNAKMSKLQHLRQGSWFITKTVCKHKLVVSHEYIYVYLIFFHCWFHLHFFQGENVQGKQSKEETFIQVTLQF